MAVINKSKDNRSAPPKIIQCSCQHSYQDEKFGKGMRFMNSCRLGWRCTVCSKVVEN